jgi:hypothetical protein
MDAMRYLRTKVRELMKLGVHKGEVIMTGASGKSYWRFSKTLATNAGVNLNVVQRDVGITFGQGALGRLSLP